MVNIITDVVSIHEASFPVNSSCSGKVMFIKMLDNVHPSVPLILRSTDNDFSPTCTMMEMGELTCIWI